MSKPKTDEERLAELEEKQAHLNKQLEGLWPHIKRLRAKIIRAECDKLTRKGLTPKAIMAMNWEQVGSGYGDGVWEEVQKYMETWRERGVRQDGYDSETKQMSLGIVLDGNRPLKDQMGIAKWIPYIKPTQGVTYIDILEHTLSEHGIYVLRIEDDKFILQKTTYGRTKDLKTFDTLKDAMKYIYDHHPYQRKKGSYEDEEEY